MKKKVSKVKKAAPKAKTAARKTATKATATATYKATNIEGHAVREGSARDAILRALAKGPKTREELEKVGSDQTAQALRNLIALGKIAVA